MALPCNRCGSALPAEVLRSVVFLMCPDCGADNLVRAFPALVETRAATAAMAAGGGEATCFDHPAKQAVHTCSQCGRFLCSLCSVDFKGEIWCPSCIESGIRKRSVADLENHRTLYDSLALALATLPVLLIWPSLLTAPIALYIAIRYWKRPTSIVRTSRWRNVAAIVLASIQVGAWAWGIAYFVATVRSRVS
jgi:hypothetical protein